MKIPPNRWDYRCQSESAAGSAVGPADGDAPSILPTPTPGERLTTKESAPRDYALTGWAGEHLSGTPGTHNVHMTLVNIVTHSEAGWKASGPRTVAGKPANDAKGRWGEGTIRAKLALEVPTSSLHHSVARREQYLCATPSGFQVRGNHFTEVFRERLRSRNTIGRLSGSRSRFWSSLPSRHCPAHPARSHGHTSGRDS